MFFEEWLKKIRAIAQPTHAALTTAECIRLGTGANPLEASGLDLGADQLSLHGKRQLCLMGGPWGYLVVRRTLVPIVLSCCVGRVIEMERFPGSSVSRLRPARGSRTANSRASESMPGPTSGHRLSAVPAQALPGEEAACQRRRECRPVRRSKSMPLEAVGVSSKKAPRAGPSCFRAL